MLELKGTIAKSEINGALVLLETGKLVTQMLEQFNGDDIVVKLYIDGVLYEGQVFEGVLTAIFSENNDTVDETIIVMENDGGVDDIVDILGENIGSFVSIVVNT